MTIFWISLIIAAFASGVFLGRFLEAFIQTAEQLNFADLDIND